MEIIKLIFIKNIISKSEISFASIFTHNIRQK